MVKGLSKTQRKEEICKCCILGKQYRESFPIKKSWRAQAPLELVHIDIYGPNASLSIGKGSYSIFITFIDDYYRKTWVYFL